MLKRMHRPLRAAFPLLFFLLLNLPAVSVAAPLKARITAGSSQVAKAEMTETKGILEPVIELVNGSNLQQSSLHLKKNIHPYHICSDAAMALLHYTAGAYTYHLQHARLLPLYIANRSILI